MLNVCPFPLARISRSGALYRVWLNPLPGCYLWPICERPTSLGGARLYSAPERPYESNVQSRIVRVTAQKDDCREYP
jgi:hypothetical protein